MNDWSEEFKSRRALARHRRTKDGARELRNQIAELIKEDRGDWHIANVLDCSMTAVQNVRRKMKDPNWNPDFDGREQRYSGDSKTTAKRPAKAAYRTVRDRVIDAHEATHLGPVTLWIRITREPEAFGLREDEIPSYNVIKKWVDEYKNANKPKRTRRYNKMRDDD